MNVLVVNPLRAALAHYELELVDVLGRCGATVEAIGTKEPSAGGGSPVAWLREYARMLRSASPQQHDRVISCWPALGYLDLIALRTLAPGGVRSSLVLHDPHPLVSARGYDAVSRVAGAATAGHRVDAIVHSQAAATVVAKEAGALKTHLLPHPMLAPETPAPRRQEDVRRVTVIGQYKLDRDLDALRSIAAAAPPHWDLRIHGRGWPALEGWHVTDAFLTEAEFGGQIRDSDVVLIPYARFFQSGIALRCLEQGTPCVGPRDSSLLDVLGDVPWLVTGNDWTAAINQAFAARPPEVVQAAERNHAHAVQRWRTWLSAP